MCYKTAVHYIAMNTEPSDLIQHTSFCSSLAKFATVCSSFPVPYILDVFLILWSLPGLGGGIGEGERFICNCVLAGNEVAFLLGNLGLVHLLGKGGRSSIKSLMPSFVKS